MLVGIGVPRLAFFVHKYLVKIIHIHHPQDYIIGQTRILANPRGYDGREAIADDFKLAYVTI